MPQASDELSGRMLELFGDDVDNAGPMRFLEGQGFKLTPGWSWAKPGVTRWQDLTEEQQACIAFLAEEWDFGGLETQQPGERGNE